MNNEYNYILFLARSFLRAQGLGLLSFTNNDLFPFLARIFGLCRLSFMNNTKSLYPLCSLWLNCKTKPIQSQFKPKQSQFFGGFWRKNFNFSLKIDDTKLNFLCKTKPIYKNEQWSMSFQKTLIMQNEPNLNIFLTS